jgi:hypothetical protein
LKFYGMRIKIDKKKKKKEGWRGQN